MPRPSPFAIPPRILVVPLATLDELHDASESAARRGIRATMAATETLLQTWFTEHPDEDEELVTEWTHLRDRCARILATPPPASLGREDGADEPMSGTPPAPFPLAEQHSVSEYADLWRAASVDERRSLAAEIRALPDEVRAEIRELVSTHQQPIGEIS